MFPDDSLFLRGCQLFNEREFFACHEVLEELWNQEEGAEKEFIQGLIQIAVAYHHLLKNNPVGAGKLFLRGSQRLEPFRPCHRRIKVDLLLDAVKDSQKGRSDIPLLLFEP